MGTSTRWVNSDGSIFQMGPFQMGHLPDGSGDGFQMGPFRWVNLFRWVHQMGQSSQMSSPQMSSSSHLPFPKYSETDDKYKRKIEMPLQHLEAHCELKDLMIN